MSSEDLPCSMHNRWICLLYTSVLYRGLPGVLPAHRVRAAYRWGRVATGRARGERLMQRIYEPENLLEGQMLVDMLASEGVEAHLLRCV